MRIAATSTEPNPWSGTTPPQGAATARIRIRNALDRTLHRATHPGGGCGPRIRHQHRPLQWTVPHRTSGQCLTQRERSEWEHVVLPHRPRLDWGRRKSPSLDVLYETCQMAGVVCGHVYLFRDPREVVVSTTVHREIQSHSSRGSALVH